jgi:hypothetical protein
MPVKNLIFTVIPARSHDRASHRRAKLVERLEEQKRLLDDPSFVRRVQRWTGKEDQRRTVEVQQRVRPWWRADAGSGVVLSVFLRYQAARVREGYGRHRGTLKGQARGDHRPLIAAVRAGELDELMARQSKPVGQKVRKAA